MHFLSLTISVYHNKYTFLEFNKKVVIITSIHSLSYPRSHTHTHTHIAANVVLLLQFKALLLPSRPLKASVITVRQSSEPAIVSAMAESH